MLNLVLIPLLAFIVSMPVLAEVGLSARAAVSLPFVIRIDDGSREFSFQFADIHLDSFAMDDYMR